MWSEIKFETTYIGNMSQLLLQIRKNHTWAGFNCIFREIWSLKWYQKYLVTIKLIIESYVSYTDLSVDMLIFLVLDWMDDSKGNSSK